MLKPLPGYALVRLKEKYESGLSTEKEKYAQRYEGTLVESTIIVEDTEFGIEVAEHRSSMLKPGVTVYFAPFTEGESIEHEGSEYVFLPTKELRGVKTNA